MNYHGRIVERNEGRMGLWRNVSWSVLSGVILDMVTAFYDYTNPVAMEFQSYGKVPPLLPNRPRSYLPPVPIPRMGEQVNPDDALETRNHFAAFRWILDHADEPVGPGCGPCHLHFAILKQGTRQSPTRFSTWAAHKTQPNFVAILSLRQGLRCRRMFPNLWTGCLICARA